MMEKTITTLSKIDLNIDINILRELKDEKSKIVYLILRFLISLSWVVAFGLNVETTISQLMGLF